MSDIPTSAKMVVLKPAKGWLGRSERVLHAGCVGHVGTGKTNVGAQHGRQGLSGLFLHVGNQHLAAATGEMPHARRA